MSRVAGSRCGGTGRGNSNVGRARNGKGRHGIHFLNRCGVPESDVVPCAYRRPLTPSLLAVQAKPSPKGPAAKGRVLVRTHSETDKRSESSSSSYGAHRRGSESASHGPQDSTPRPAGILLEGVPGPRDVPGLCSPWASFSPPSCFLLARPFYKARLAAPSIAALPLNATVPPRRSASSSSGSLRAFPLALPAFLRNSIHA